MIRNAPIVSRVLSLWREPSAEQLAARELEAARRNLIEAHRHAEYYALMVTFERQRIARLSKTLKEIAE